MPENDPLYEVMTAKEVAEEYKIKPRTVQDAIEYQYIEARKSGGTWLLRRADVDKRWAKTRDAKRST